jgi:hypothetical protein
MKKMMEEERARKANTEQLGAARLENAYIKTLPQKEQKLIVKQKLLEREQMFAEDDLFKNRWTIANGLANEIEESDPSNSVIEKLRYALSNRQNRGKIKRSAITNANYDQTLVSLRDELKNVKSRGKSFSGRGMTTPEPPLVSSTKYNSKNGKIYLDLKNLKKNILSVKYHSSNKYKISPTHVSDNVRIVIMEIVMRNTINPDVFEALSKSDIRLVENFIVVFDNEAEVKGFDQYNSLRELYQQFEVLKGQISIGNNNPVLKKQLKLVVIELMDLGRIPKNQGKNILDTI